MLIEATLVIVTLLALAVAALCVAMLYRMRSGDVALSPLLDQRLVGATHAHDPVPDRLDLPHRL